jgi:hypothetical protein
MKGKDKKCFVCGGVLTTDGGVDLDSGEWICSPGCWSDYHIAVAYRKTQDTVGTDSFIKSIKSFTK